MSWQNWSYTGETVDYRQKKMISSHQQLIGVKSESLKHRKGVWKNSLSVYDFSKPLSITGREENSPNLLKGSSQTKNKPKKTLQHMSRLMIKYWLSPLP